LLAKYQMPGKDGCCHLWILLLQVHKLAFTAAAAAAAAMNYWQ
jgi:hypothetical protein